VEWREDLNSSVSLCNILQGWSDGVCILYGVLGRHEYDHENK